MLAVAWNIKLVYLPSYSSNLNMIERLWPPWNGNI
ncbi:transposase [Chondrinema litorale]